MNWDETVERAKAWLGLGRAFEPKEKEPEPPVKKPAEETTNMPNPTNPPASHDEWQRALDAPWQQSDLHYVRNIAPEMVRDAGEDPVTGEKLLASPFTKREVYDLLTRYPSTPLKPPRPPPPEDAEKDELLRKLYPTHFRAGGKR